ncbi:hypothetical protein [Rhizobium esperanzae]|uniref:Uncharacterized protein n=1 Tax=Rhizobium esperanzae TaxID=1967781 RepID=A0A7W6R4Q1_9HYPH|nr:hypothetical protein [Rhizobium esperanzae]MBB4236619.1 hypothetical protein [Rhizobium esperanzae]
MRHLWPVRPAESKGTGGSSSFFILSAVVGIQVGCCPSTMGFISLLLKKIDNARRARLAICGTSIGNGFRACLPQPRRFVSRVSEECR